MPLDNKHVIQKDGMTTTETKMFDCTYELMVQIYDINCQGCGFALMEVGEMGDKHYLTFTDLGQAIAYAISTNQEIYRTCDYPADSEEINIYDPRTQTFQTLFPRPSLRQIVANTCRFWDKSNIEMDEEEDAYIE